VTLIDNKPVYNIFHPAHGFLFGMTKDFKPQWTHNLSVLDMSKKFASQKIQNTIDMFWKFAEFDPIAGETFFTIRLVPGAAVYTVVDLFTPAQRLGIKAFCFLSENSWFENMDMFYHRETRDLSLRQIANQAAKKSFDWSEGMIAVVKLADIWSEVRDKVRSRIATPYTKNELPDYETMFVEAFEEYIDESIPDGVEPHYVTRRANILLFKSRRELMLFKLVCPLEFVTLDMKATKAELAEFMAENKIEVIK